MLACCSFGSARDDILAGLDGALNLYDGNGRGRPASITVGVFDHHDGIGACGDGSPGHDFGTFASINDNVTGVLSGSDFGNDLQAGWNLSQIGGPDGKAITRGSWKRRQVAVGADLLGENAASGRQEVTALSLDNAELAGMIFDGATRGFKRQDSHGSIETSGTTLHNRFIFGERLKKKMMMNSAAALL